MGKGVNKIFLLGAVGKDPEVRATQSGSVVASFSLATSDRVKKNDVWEEETTWHNLVAFARTAEVVRDYVKKGTQLFVEGKVTNRSWDDKQSGEKKYKTEILVNELTLLGGKSEGSPENGQKSSGRTQTTTTRSAAPAPARTQTAPATRTAVVDDDPFGDGTGISDSDLPDF